MYWMPQGMQQKYETAVKWRCGPFERHQQIWKDARVPGNVKMSQVDKIDVVQPSMLPPGFPGKL